MPYNTHMETQPSSSARSPFTEEVVIPPSEYDWTATPDAVEHARNAADAYEQGDHDHNHGHGHTEIAQEYAAAGPQPAFLAPTNRVVLPINCTRSQAVAVLTKRAPINEYGLPQFFVRSDLLPAALQTLTQQDVDIACEGLFYHEGFPTLQNGVAFWHRLPYEPLELYNLFRAFIDQAEELGIRQTDLLADAQNMEPEALQSVYHEYHWSYRARAHDLFVVAAEQKRRYIVTRKTENKHFKTAGELLDILLGRFAGEFEDWIQELNAKEAVEVLEKLVNIQRISLGLNNAKGGAGAGNGVGEGAPTEAIIRNIARGAGMGQRAEDNFADKLRALTENPEDGMVLQEAILRIGVNQRTGDFSTDHMGLS